VRLDDLGSPYVGGDRQSGNGRGRHCEEGGGPAGCRTPWAEALRELGAVDRAVYQTVAITATPQLDDVFRRLSILANYSRLWLGMAAVMATLGGSRGRRVALEGVLAIGATSATVMAVSTRVGPRVTS